MPEADADAGGGGQGMFGSAVRMVLIYVAMQAFLGPKMKPAQSASAPTMPEVNTAGNNGVGSGVGVVFSLPFTFGGIYYLRFDIVIIMKYRNKV